jgi:hypothetical protein
VVAADFAEAGDEDVFRKIAKDLKDKNVSVTDETIRQKMAQFQSQAREQLMSES